MKNCLVLCLAAASLNAATFSVINTNQAGAGSLPQAIIDANALPGPDMIAFNIPDSSGLMISPTNALPAITDPVTIDAWTQPGTFSVSAIELNGQSAGAGVDGLRIMTSNCIITGLAINRFAGDGIEISGGYSNQVRDCVLGLSGDGLTARANTGSGLFLTNSPHNLITRCYIAANSQNGIHIGGSNSASNLVEQNVIGLGVDGARRANGQDGIRLNAPGNIIGEPGSLGNVISGNSSDGIEIVNAGSSNNIITGNSIGLSDYHSFGGLPNRGNSGDGINVNNAPWNQIVDNVIVANGSDGVELNGLNSATNVVVGNLIGTTGSPAANNGHGVQISNNARGNQIGGLNPAQQNTIAYNGQDGVFITAGTNNVVRGNSTFDNGNLGIDLGSNGVTPNDSGDPDSGANLLQNFPVLAAATNTPAGLAIAGALNSRPNASYEIDFYSSPGFDSTTNGEGQIYLGSIGVTTGADSNAAFAVVLPGQAAGRYISATAIDTNGNTSEFSRSIRAESTVAPATFSVVNTNHAGPGSLRQAILDNNLAASSGRNTIAFNIPGPGPHVIQPLSALPFPVEPVSLDGYTQPGSSPNTLTNGNNAVLLIQLDGAAAGLSDGLRLTTPGHRVRGLSITRFNNDGIEISTNGNNTVEGCWIGIDTTGTNAAGNGAHGVHITTPFNVVGGTAPDARNVIAANSQHGIHLSGSGATSNRVAGNFIGTDATGTLDLGNNGNGIHHNNALLNVTGGDEPGAGNVLSGNQGDGVGATGAFSLGNIIAGNSIGTDASGLAPLGNNGSGVTINGNARSNLVGSAGRGNIVAFNGGNGVTIGGGTNNSIRFNSIHRNASLGIDLGNNWLTPNDSNDADTGANHLQNYPILTGGLLTPSNSVVQGTLHSRANSSYTIDVYASLRCDDTGFGEGQQHLGSTGVTTDANGDATFDVILPGLAAGRYLTATATDASGNTSEFSECFRAGSAFPPMTFTVVNTNDSGPGSLRQALLDAGNFHSGSPHLISFNIPGPGPHTISPLTQMSTNREAVFIDGYSQPGSATNSLALGFNADIRIRIDGASFSGFGGAGLRLQAGHSTVRGLAFTRWNNRDAIIITDGGSNVVAGCLIGVNLDGSDSHASSGVTIVNSAGNEIGGLSAGDRNVISYNFAYGVGISGPAASNNVVRGNFIGTDFTGTQRRGNSTGIDIDGGSRNVIGGADPAARNIISAHFLDGIRIRSSEGLAVGNIIEGNYIGTDVTGTVRLGNNSDGIQVNGFETFIGGNIISGNAQWGIDLAPGSGGAMVLGNRIGVGATGATLSNVVAGIAVSSSTNRIGGTSPGEGNIIAFNGNQGVIVAAGTGNSIRGNSIFSNFSPFGPGLGIDVGFDGFTANDAGDGDGGVNNRQNFPLVTSASGGSGSTTVSGTLNSQPNQSFEIDVFANVLCDASGNGEGQQYLGSVAVNTDGSGNALFNITLPVTPAGRFFTANATDAAGNTSEFGPCFEGSLSIPPMTFTVVNTNDSGAGSLRQAILDSNGHVSSSNNTIAFNIPGTGIRVIRVPSPLPAFAQPVTIDGFTQPGASANTLSEGNNANWLIELRGNGANFSENVLHLNIENLMVRGLRITGSGGDGIETEFRPSFIAGCFIFGNQSAGIRTDGSARIGGTSAADRNVISSNASAGISIDGHDPIDVVIQGNFIGTDPSGSSAFGPQFWGIEGVRGGNHTIGGTASGEGNVIAFNSDDGIFIQGGAGYAIRGNRIFANGGLGIDLSPSGVTANDPGDLDNGANDVQNFPVLTNAIANAENTIVQGTLNSHPNASYALDFYSNPSCDGTHGEGQTYLGSAVVNTDASGNASFDVLLPVQVSGNAITATATDATGSTSEFSACRQPQINLPPQTYVVVNTNDSGPGSLRQAILDTALLPNVGADQIHFNIPGAGPFPIRLTSELPALAHPMVIDGYTQPGASANTSSNANNAVILVEIDGTGLGAINRLIEVRSNSTVRGLSFRTGIGATMSVNGSSNVIEGNWFGIRPGGAAGSTAPTGLEVGGRWNRIGGADPAQRNVIGLASAWGVRVFGPSNVIEGNFIGVGLSGTNALPNGEGVEIRGAANLLGGTAPGAANFISRNTGEGVVIINATRARVEGNFIGTDAATNQLGNAGHGVLFSGSSSNLIGGDLPGAGNVIAFNGGNGVFVSGQQNGIFGNAIHDNAQGDIELGFGANGGVQPPILAGAVLGSTTVHGSFQGLPNTTYRIDAFVKVHPPHAPSNFRARPSRFGSFNVTTDGSGRVSYEHTFPNSFPPFAEIYTQAHCDNNSSAHSNERPLVTTGYADLKVNMAMPDPVAQGSNFTVTVLVTNCGPGTATNASLTCGLPPGLRVNSAHGSNMTINATNNMVRCALGSLTNGEVRQVNIQVTATQRGVLIGSAQATSETPDYDHRNSADTAETFVQQATSPPPQADIAVSVNGPTNVVMGQVATYVVRVRNFGQGGATGVAARVLFARETRLNSAVSSRGTCTVKGEIVDCIVGNLAAGEEAVITIQGTPSVLGSEVVGIASSAQPDPFYNNNRAALRVVVEPPQLRALRQGNDVQILWPRDTAGLELQQSGTADFSTFARVPTDEIVINGNNNLFVPPPNLDSGFFRLGPIVPPAPFIEVFQETRDINGLFLPFTDWGRVRVNFEGKAEVQYFTLVIDGKPVVLQMPIQSFNGTGVLHAVDLHFPLLPTNGPIFDVSGGFTLSTNATDTVTQTTNFTVQPSLTVQYSGFDEVPLLYYPAEPLAGATVVSSVRLSVTNFPNREQKTNECAPAAIHNSLLYLNDHFDLDIPEVLLLPELIADGMDYVDNVGLQPPVGVTWYDHLRDFINSVPEYRVSTETTRRIELAIAGVRNGYDVEMEYQGHIACVIGIDTLSDGKYAIHVAHDLLQGREGGLVNETWTFDPASNTVSGNSWSYQFNRFVIQHP